MKAITINGKNFELGKSITKLELPPCSFQTIDDVYANPSNRKRVIFANWLSWFTVNGGYCGIGSFNSNFFTIKGVIIDNETKKQYYCYITHAHNRAYEIV